MLVDMSTWSAMKRLKYSLLRRAFDQNRGAEVILLIQWRRALEAHRNEGYVQLARKFLEENACQPRAIRALNLVAAQRGLNVVYKDTVEQAPAKVDVMARLHEARQEDRIIVPEPPKVTRIRPAPPERFGIRPMTDAEKMLKEAYRPVAGQCNNVRMEEINIRSTRTADDCRSLSLLAADKMPPGYIPH